MRILGILTALFVSGSALAVDLSIVNTSAVEVRLDSLFNRCDGAIVTPEKPVVLKPGESFDLKNITPVMHHYKICAVGFCSSTAFGIREDIAYRLEVVLDDGIVNGIALPDHWIGNTKCPGED